MATKNLVHMAQREHRRLCRWSTYTDNRRAVRDGHIGDDDCGDPNCGWGAVEDAYRRGRHQLRLPGHTECLPRIEVRFGPMPSVPDAQEFAFQLLCILGGTMSRAECDEKVEQAITLNDQEGLSDEERSRHTFEAIQRILPDALWARLEWMPNSRFAKRRPVLSARFIDRAMSPGALQDARTSVAPVTHTVAARHTMREHATTAG